MSRPQPPAPPNLARNASDVITERRSYELITPLFGGGVEPGQADPISVVRASEVRGQLRFWWRATRGGQFATVEAMRDAEEALWGGPAREQDRQQRGGQSLVQVEVEVVQSGRLEAPFEVVRGGKSWKPQGREQIAPAYAAFPLQPTEAELRNWDPGSQLKTLRVGVTFNLYIFYPQPHRTDVEAALRTWELFGGLGARTRRGFGALRLTKLDDNEPTTLLPSEPSEARETIERLLEQLIAPEAKWPDEVPHLARKPRMKLLPPSGGTALRVWSDLIARLKGFRQSRRNKHTGRKDPFGHSDWPEPNAIRQLFHLRTRGPHAARSLPKFPRAQLGLPLIFHFPHDPTVPDQTLQGNDKEAQRLASPLLLKPVACRGGKALGLALILEGTHIPNALVLEGSPRDARGDNVLRDAYLSRSEAAQVPPLSNTVDVAQAFLDSL